ncbi:glycosyltransferase [Salegentibacter salinarum]|nr:glycosyltransferase [Salegentibacter salinarum]
MNPERGGVCQAVRTVISGLSEYEVANEVVCVNSPDEDFILKSDFKVYALGPSDKFWSYSAKLMPWLRKNFSEYDAIIVHGLWQYPSYAFEKIRKELEGRGDFRQNLPKLHVMPHGMLDPYFQTAPDRKLKAIRNKIYWELIERKIVNNADAILFTCETECLMARIPFKPYHPKEEIVVGLGVEAPPEFIPEMKVSFKEQCKGIENNDYVLFLSRIHEKKGVDILVEAYADLLNNGGKAKISASKIPKLVIAGPGLASEYGKKVQNIINHNPALKENVFLPGMLSGDAKWGAFYGCEAFILPSHQENFGIAIVEAMACRKPVLITNKVNIWREILNSDAGFVEDDTLIGVSNLLERWWALDKERKDDMAKNAKINFEEKFAISKASSRLFEVLSKSLTNMEGVDF